MHQDKSQPKYTPLAQLNSQYILNHGKCDKFMYLFDRLPHHCSTLLKACTQGYIVYVLNPEWKGLWGNT